MKFLLLALLGAFSVTQALAQSTPPDLENKLGDLPKNVERVIVDDDVLLVQKGTDLIPDVIEGVIKGQ